MKLLLLSAFMLLAFGAVPKAAEKSIRVGMIGLDTSHSPAFVKILNGFDAEKSIPGAKVVCAFPGGSNDLEASYTRVEKFTAQIRDEFKVEIVPDIPTLLKKVDAVILTSVDGRVHLQQVKPVIAARKPVFIDKPMAASLQDVKAIFRLANEAKVPCWSASSMRFFPELQAAIHDSSLGRITGCDAYSPCPMEPHHPDLFWYGMHGVEVLFTVMGSQCVSVTRVSTEGTDVVTGKWADGRLGTFRGIRDGHGDYGATIFYEKGIRHVHPGEGSPYTSLLKEIVRFFQTGIVPVPQEETIAMFAFMDAAQKSKEEGGKEIALVKN